MNARVIATGEIVEVAYHGLGVYVDMNKWDKEYNFDEIIILDNGDPDYWARLEHQYAGMAMQALLSSDTMMEVLSRRDNGTMEEEVAREAFDYAHALVEKYKKEER